jgi:hypothetical protein
MASIISAGTTSGTSLNLSGDTSGVLQLASNGSTTAVTIDTSQRVGIGTSSPSSFASNANNLVIGGGTGDEGLTIYSGNSSGDSGDIYFADGTTGNDPFAGFLIYQHDTDAMRFGTAATERMRIDSGGNLLIGTTSIGNTTSGSNVRFGQAGNGAMASIFQSGVANNGTVDIDVGGGGGGNMCILEASNSNASNANVATRKIFAVMGRATTFVFTEIGTQNGTSGGFGFSMSCPSAGRLRLTNTAGSNGDVVLALFGTAAY